ncbi:Phytoene dehydrogenase-related protein [Nakamurella panacisegetis]|uniref:Pyridine nucleotide-disulfide oxidoreductase domain-containing protein 2 n=1 Tax=Nakamurella panacisegetis TaxID=1090615 RepID=A0A1H0QKD2_9ACTN|nr:NAD(P)/FAD-dependent oxidoreductase [Nakamurella panacisegetis]SDP17764.1 Phytoene dehydrogenase-related protein [Nakamurella panacisegetis]
MRRSVDAVVIGAGPNGLVAANLLADAGWGVLLLEAEAKVGGAVASDSDVADGFEHDTFSSFYPLVAASPVMRGLELERHGLAWSHAPAVIGTPDVDGRWALLHHDPQRTAAGLDELHAGDGQGWLDLVDQWQTLGGPLIDSLLSPFPPVRAGLRLAATLPKVGGAAGIRLLIESARSLTERHLAGETARLLIVGNAAHADLSPDAAGSGVFGLLLAMMGQQDGFPVPTGGAGRLADALAARFVAAGGEIRCGAEVTEVVVDRGRAVGVRLSDGEFVRASSVVADVSAPALYGGLVSWNDLPARTRARMADFQWDPGTIKVDWALSGTVPWLQTPAAAPGTVHLASSVTEVSTWMAQVTGGTVPADPFLLVGQMTTSDPTRSPPGTEALWSYTHVPQQVRHDELDRISGRWDGSEINIMADRMQDRIERAAPGFTSRIVQRRILGPRELQGRNQNLHRGALGGGTAALHQELIFRPVTGWGRAETPIKGLYLGSASAHPGGGVHGACGANAARAALFHRRLSFRNRR